MFHPRPSLFLAPTQLKRAQQGRPGSKASKKLNKISLLMFSIDSNEPVYTLSCFDAK
jgi:hypothetical protein